MTELEFVDVHYWKDNGKGEHVRAVKTTVVVDGLVQQLQETRERIDVERASMQFGTPQKLFRNGQINMIDWLLKVLGANKDGV